MLYVALFTFLMVAKEAGGWIYIDYNVVFIQAAGFF